MAKITPFTVVWLGFFIRCTSCPAIGQVAAVHAAHAVQVVHTAAVVTGGTSAGAPVHWRAVDVPASAVAEARSAAMGEMAAVDRPLLLKQEMRGGMWQHLQNVLLAAWRAWRGDAALLHARSAAISTTANGKTPVALWKRQQPRSQQPPSDQRHVIRRDGLLPHSAFEARFIVHCPSATQCGTTDACGGSHDSAWSEHGALQQWMDDVLFAKLAFQQWANDTASWQTDFLDSVDRGSDLAVRMSSARPRDKSSTTTTTNENAAVAFDVRASSLASDNDADSSEKKVNARVYVLGFDDQSIDFAKMSFATAPWAVVTALATNKYLESNMYFDGLLSRYHEWKSLDYVGAISWRARTKRPFADRLEEDLHGLLHADVIPFMYHGRGNISLVQYDHTYLPELWVYLLTQLGFTEEQALSPDIPFFYSNYWVAKPPVMLQYIQFARRARQVLEEVQDPRILAMLYSDPHYEDPPQHFKMVTGFPRYTYHPFLMERLVCFFCHINNLRVVPVFWLV